MLERILLEVCQMMDDTLDKDQMEKLKNVLYINFRGKNIVEERYEIVPAESDKDTKMLQLFRATKMIAGRAAGTIDQYISELKRLRNAVGKGFCDITTMDLRWYFGMLQENRNNKMLTIQNKIHYINSFYSFLLGEGIIKNNPVARIEPPKVEQTIKKPFTAEDMEAIRKCCTHVRDRALVEFLCSTGLRVSELVSLNVGDVDMERKEFAVIGKGNKERTVYFSPAAHYHLKIFLKWRQEIEGKSMEQLSESPLFSCIKKPYNRITKAGIEFLCRKIGMEAGIKNVHPHRFRRTFATNMAARDMKLQELMKLMGHSKMDTTLIYCSIAQDSVRNAYYKCA